MLTQERLKSVLSYVPDTGEFTWLVTSGRAKAGALAGSLSPDGYIRIGIDGQRFLAHRLAWLYAHGQSPEIFIDHINGNKVDNRISNLREATPAESSQNTARYSSNTSGFTGVVFNKKHNKYHARITHLGTMKHLGHYDTPESAFEAHKEAKRLLHSFNPEVPSRGQKAAVAP